MPEWDSFHRYVVVSARWFWFDVQPDIHVLRICDIIDKPCYLCHATNQIMAQQHHSVAEEPVTSVLPDGDVPFDSNHALTADEEVLAALGYKSEFKREFSLFTTFCVSFAVLGLLPSFASTLYYGMGYAGTAGMTWGWIVAMLGIQCVAMSMAELCSSMPTSGGLYYAAAVLAPPGWGPFAAWITGWSNWCAQVTAAPSGEDSERLEQLGACG
jgi:hypothetical protein